jgi:hypothetical protein
VTEGVCVTCTINITGCTYHSHVHHIFMTVFVLETNFIEKEKRVWVVAFISTDFLLYVLTRHTLPTDMLFIFTAVQV